MSDVLAPVDEDLAGADRLGHGRGVSIWILTLKQLTSVFEKFNIAEINPVGEKFDAHKHQAIGVLESEQEANTVVSVMQKGYTLSERVLRPALVMVAKAKE